MKQTTMMKKTAALSWFLAVFLFPALIAAEGYDDGVRTEVLLKATTTSNGQRLQYLKTDKAAVTVMKVMIAPGRETGWHLHDIPVYSYVISGKMTLETANGNNREFKEGQVILQAVNNPHNGINTGDKPLEMIVFYTGAEDIPLVRKVNPPGK